MRRLKRRWSLLWAARFVAKWEGFLPYAYLDTIASPAVWTIGYGHTGDVHQGDHVTAAQARALLAKDLRSAAAAVSQKVDVKLTVRQRIALISFVFNVGPGGLDGTEVQKALNEGRYAKAALHMLDWNHAGGVEVQGLTNRRHAEAWLMTHSKPHRRPAQKAGRGDHVHTKARKKERR